MKLTFKVDVDSKDIRCHQRLIKFAVQDLKQQKFVIDAEPSETVCAGFPSWGLLFKQKHFVIGELRLIRGYNADR